MTIINRIGISTNIGKGDLSGLDRDLGRYTDLGADIAELSLYGEDLIAGGRVLEERARRLADICARHSLQYTAHGQIISNFMDERHIDWHKAVVTSMLELCNRVGASTLVHHCGKAPMQHRMALERLEAMEREALQEMGDVAKRYGVRIAVENIFLASEGEYRQSPSEVADTVRRVDHPNVCATIDFSHAMIECARRGLDWRHEIAAMAPVAGHLHVHDSFGRPYTVQKFFTVSEEVGLGIGDLHLPLGWGNIEWEEIFSSLTFRPGTDLILELSDRYDNELPASLDRARSLADICNKAKSSAS